MVFHRVQFLGPLFVIIYINDLYDPSRPESILFADDTNLFISENDPVTLNNILNNGLDKLSRRFAANKLSLNISKTKFMVFRPRQKRLCSDFHISINGEALIQVSETPFLDVLLDDCLPGKFHISLVVHKISNSIGIIYKSLHSSQVAHQAGAYPGFCSIKRLGVFLLPPGWDASPSLGYPAIYSPVPIYTPGWREAP